MPRRLVAWLAGAALLAPLAVAGGPLPAAASSPAAATGSPADARTAAPVDPPVARALASKGASDLWVVLDERADLRAAAAVDDWTERGEAVVEALQATARSSQGPVLAALSDGGVRHTAFWASNRVLVHDADEALTARLSGLDGVARIAATQVLELPEPVGPAEPAGPPDPTGAPGTLAVEWGVAAVNADDVWTGFGVRGEGLVVGSIDSGVQFDHPALAASYRGASGPGAVEHDHHWFDPSGTCGPPTAAPCDNNGHGTHTMGTMVGEAGDDQIGVAPGARWVAAKGCETNGCSDASLLASGQWMLAPTDRAGEDPRPDLRPHVVNNSWGAGNGAEVDPWYDDVIRAWTASGIFGVFSNGNEGPGCDTTGSPADSVHAFGVGGFRSDGGVYTSSSRGPGQPGLIRPNLSAPAVDVRSSLPGNGYGTASGTSMAAPHVSGTVALMWSAAPALTGDVQATRELLAATAVDTDDTTCGGTPGNNNVWGEGKLDALAAVEASPRGPTGTLSGTVTDADGDPVAGARVSTDGEVQRSTTTDEDGTWSLRLPVGERTVTFTAFGYAPASRTVTVTEDATTTVDVVLDAAPVHEVRGTVRDERGEPVAGAQVALVGTPVAPVTSGGDGAWSLGDVPEGRYRLTASGTQCTADVVRELVVDGPQDVQVVLPDRTDAFGHRCTTEPAQWVDTDTVLPLTGDDATTPLATPFPVTLYGETHHMLWVSTNGHLNVLGPVAAFSNGTLPSATEPNGAVYAFWDDLVVDDQASVRTGTSGQAPDRVLVVEWRDATFFGDGETRVDAQVRLHESGEVVLAWRGIDPGSARERGSSATVGIEDRTGTDALQYSADEPVLEDGVAVRFTPPPSGVVQGTVTDAVDGGPVAGTTVTLTGAGGAERETVTGADGAYRVTVPVGSWTLRAEAPRYEPAERQVQVADGDVVTVDLALRTAAVEVDPGRLSWLLAAGERAEATVTVRNPGLLPLRVEVSESGGAAVPAHEPAGALAARAGELDLEARTARVGGASSAPAAPSASASAAPSAGQDPRTHAPGDVIASWPATGLSTPWGLGRADGVWVSDADTGGDVEFTVDGTPTGRTLDPPWASTWNADLAHDTRRDRVCQVAVGGDNGIHCWDPATGQEDDVLTGPWSAVSQRGVAYRADDDTFYVGGWNEDVVYHVAGPSHAEPGAVLSSCSAPLALAGLAWNPTAQVLWAATSSEGNLLHRLDPDDCTSLGTLGFPEATPYSGAGLDLDPNGDLWLVSQSSGTVYRVDSGLPVDLDVPWLAVEPREATVPPGGTVELEVAVDTTGLAAGVYRAELVLRTDAGRRPQVRVPVELVVSGSWTSVNAGGGEEVAADGRTWVADREHTEGGFGWLGRSTTATERTAQIGGTDDDALFRDQRQGMDAYRFDDLPAGTYEVRLGFAELLTRPRTDWRRFDVRVDGQWALVGYDVAAQVGGRHADVHVFRAEVEEDGGSLVVEFLDRRGYRPAIVSTVEVVHRPDL
ncbi:carboxypeptidase regulatory-like domain-containing protein [Thalassiella azotivora]